MRMTLDEAIIYLKRKADIHGHCALTEKYIQVAAWLIELKERRAKDVFWQE